MKNGLDNEKEYRQRCQVLFSLKPDIITILLGVGVGLLDGGVEVEIPTDEIPADLRMPNSEFILVHRMNPFEIVDIERVNQG